MHLDDMLSQFSLPLPPGIPKTSLSLFYSLSFFRLIIHLVQLVGLLGMLSDHVQLITAAGNSWVRWPCHVLKTGLHVPPHFPVLSSSCPSSVMSLIMGGENCYEVSLRAEHALDTSPSPLISCWPCREKLLWLMWSSSLEDVLATCHSDYWTFKDCCTCSQGEYWYMFFLSCNVCLLWVPG